MQIRHAVPTDFLSIAALDRNAWSKNRQSQFIPDGEHAWRVWIDTAMVLVAEDENEIVAAALAFADLSGGLFLHKVFTREDWRGRGVGKLLLQDVNDFADREQRRLRLTVDPVNKKAISLYQKCGYKVLERVEAYYRETEPRLIMERRPSAT